MSAYSDRVSRKAAAARFLDDTPAGRLVKRMVLKSFARGLVYGALAGSLAMWLALRG